MKIISRHATHAVTKINTVNNYFVRKFVTNFLSMRQISALKEKIFLSSFFTFDRHTQQYSIANRNVLRKESNVQQINFFSVPFCSVFIVRVSFSWSLNIIAIRWISWRAERRVERVKNCEWRISNKNRKHFFVWNLWQWLTSINSQKLFVVLWKFCFPWTIFLLVFFLIFGGRRKFIIVEFLELDQRIGIFCELKLMEN